MRFADVMGWPGVFRRGGIAMHVSGLDDFGDQSGPGFVRAMAIYSVIWKRPPGSISGLGCRQPEPAVIVSWDGRNKRGHLDDRWAHITHWGSCLGYWTLEGILNWAESMGCPMFSAGDLVAYVNQRRSSTLMLGDQQRRSVSRLIEASVGLSNHKIPGAGTLQRVGRWKYRFVGPGRNIGHDAVVDSGHGQKAPVS